MVHILNFPLISHISFDGIGCGPATSNSSGRNINNKHASPLYQGTRLEN